MKKITNGLKTIFSLIAITIAVLMYNSHRPLHVKQVEGVIISMQPDGGGFNKRCYRITSAINGIVKQPFEIGKKNETKPNEVVFRLCVYGNDDVVYKRAVSSMADIQKVQFIYIDDYYWFENKLSAKKFNLATIKKLP